MQTANFWQIGGLLLLLCTCGSPLIVPTGLVSLLHYIYSRIPIINKGTDSRLGVGFRLGPHADLQFLVELGPQQYTQSLGDPQNPAPCCGYDEPPGVHDVPNQLTVRSPAVRSLEVRSSTVRSSTVRVVGANSNGGGGDERKARSGATDWLGRWQRGIKGRSTKSHQEKTENVGSTKKASTPLLTALHRFRDLWVAGRKATAATH